MVKAALLNSAPPENPLRISSLESNSMNTSKGKRTHSTENTKGDAVSGEAKKKEVPWTGVPTRGSPWESYTKEYELDLGGPAIVSVCDKRLVNIRAFPTSAAEKILHKFRQVQHDRPVNPLAAFATEDFLYIVFEPMVISLWEVVRCPAYPDEQQLRALLGQLVEGIDYLASEGLEHGHLSCSYVLLNLEGDVKLAYQEAYVPRSKSELRDVRALSSIMMQLMQKYDKENGAIGIDDVRRWNLDSDSVTFLSATTSAVSAAELLEHSLLSPPYQKESLIGLISLSQVAMRGHYKYTPLT